MPDHPSSTTDDRVVHIRTGRRYQAGADGPAAPDDDHLDRFARSGEPDDFRHRMLVNAIAFLFVAALVVSGVWLADRLATMRKNQDCVLSGNRACAPIEVPAPVR